MLRAVRRAADEGLSHEQFGDALRRALGFDPDNRSRRIEWMLDPDPRGFQALDDAKRALNQVLAHRLWNDLRRGWRYTNPPWERIKLQEQEFFAGTAVADAPHAAARTKLIVDLGRAEPGTPDRALFDAFQIAKRVAEATSAFARVPGDEGGRYAYTGTGDVNTYALFAEHFLNLTREGGRAGVIVPTGIATDATTAPFFEHLINEDLIRTLFDFRNKGFFESVAQAQGVRFSLLTLGHGIFSTAAEFCFRLEAVPELDDTRRRFSLTASAIARINPNTKNAPLFHSREDARLTGAIYERVPVFIEDSKAASGNPWDIKFLAMLHMANDSGLFRTADQLSADGSIREGANWVSADPDAEQCRRFVPLYEAKMLHQYNHRHGDYALAKIVPGKEVRQILQANLAVEGWDYETTPRYWIDSNTSSARLTKSSWTRSWVFGWRDITSSIDERTLISAIAPSYAFNDKFLLCLPNAGARLSVSLHASLNGLVCDYLARQKLGGTSFKYFVIKQLPILPPTAYTEADLAFIVPRVLELTYTSHAMAPFASDLGYDGTPFTWDEDRRAQLRAELDAWYALAYGLTRDELRYVLDPKDVMGADYPSETFRVLQKNETAKYGEYRTQRLVLAAYDAQVAAAPDTASLADGQLQGAINDELDVRLLLAAIVKRMQQPRPLREVIFAFLYAAQPHLLMPHLTAAAAAEWQRLVGDAAALPVSASVPSFSASRLVHFAPAQAQLAARRAWRFDVETSTVDRGAAIYDIPLPQWAEGRADFVWHALRSIDLNAATATLSQGEQDFVAQAAAA